MLSLLNMCKAMDLILSTGRGGGGKGRTKGRKEGKRKEERKEIMICPRNFAPVFGH